jgi:uncharacterized protein YggE
MSTRNVTVTGHATTTVTPDSAVVRVAAVARAGGVAEAFRACSSAAAEIGAVARRHTDENRIASTGIHVWPWHDNQGQPRGFEARHSLSIGCADLDGAGALLGELAAGIGDALAVEGVALEVSSATVAQEQAVAAAYDDAVRQATQLAGLAGASLGQVLAIGNPSPSGGGTVHHEATAMSAKIEPGETVVGASVTVTWSLG